MTRLFKQAIAVVSKLSEEEQDAIARAVLDEVEADAQWDLRFAQSGETLAELVAEARAEHRAGLTRPLDPGQM